MHILVFRTFKCMHVSATAVLHAFREQILEMEAGSSSKIGKNSMNRFLSAHRKLAEWVVSIQEDYMKVFNPVLKWDKEAKAG